MPIVQKTAVLVGGTVALALLLPLGNSSGASSGAAASWPRYRVMDMTAPPAAGSAAARSATRAGPPTILSADVRLNADRVMARDAGLRALLAGTTARVTREGPWTGKRNQTRFGVVRELALGHPIDLPLAVRPVVVWEDAADSYRSYGLNAAYRGVTALTVYIDDAKGVVQVQPDSGAVYLQGPGNAWIAALADEGTD